MGKTLIVTGSRGLIGPPVVNHFKKIYDVLELDLRLGHDLTDEEFVKSWFKENKADYLINLFAINDHVDKNRVRDKSTLFDISLDSFQKFLDVNLTALFSVCREFARNNDSGVIVNFSSTYGLVSPRPDMYNNYEKHIGYSVSKAGVIQLTRHLAAHLAPNFRVNCVVPGGVEYQQSEDFKKRYSSHTPLGRMMNVDELNGVLEYLCSEKSTYTTGAVFTVDGGWTIL